MRPLAILAVLALVACGGQPAEEPAAEAAAPAPSPPGTDIHLFALSPEGAEHIRHVTDRRGYDNQPYFSPDSRALLFTSDREGQMETFAFDLETGTTRRVTETQEGEYSPTFLPDDSDRFSVIRMDTSGVQELWTYSLDGTDRGRLADVDRVGYHTWVGNDRILFFRLGSPSTLQLVTEGLGDTTVVAASVGRSLHRIPGQRASSYLIRESDEHAEIRSYDWDTGESSSIAATLPGQEFYAWTPDGAILMAVEATLYRYVPGQSVDWEEMADLGLSGVSRLAVSTSGQHLAVVAARSE